MEMKLYILALLSLICSTSLAHLDNGGEPQFVFQDPSPLHGFSEEYRNVSYSNPGCLANEGGGMMANEFLLKTPSELGVQPIIGRGLGINPRAQCVEYVPKQALIFFITQRDFPSLTAIVLPLPS